MLMSSINEIIDRYKSDKELYGLLKRYYISFLTPNSKKEEALSNVKKTLVDYYLKKYKYVNYMDDNLHNTLLLNISDILDYNLKAQVRDGKFKIYPVKESEEKKKKTYEMIMKKMVDYQIEKDCSFDDVIRSFIEATSIELNDIKSRLIKGDMEPYYGNAYFLIERSKYIIECVKAIPGVSLDLNDIYSLMTMYEDKYYSGVDEYERDNDFIAPNYQFYEDYDKIEGLYKELTQLEDRLAPVVADYWKKYLTDPSLNEDEYRYVMHSFSAGMVDPAEMRKACCSLHTNKIDNYMYGTSGLIYDIDAESLGTMCTDDAGSWLINKEKFIEDRMPGRWQLPDTHQETVFYENPRISKIIMPEVFERECEEQIRTNEGWHYSEIYLNGNAKALGVFYTDDCPNIEEVQRYATKYNLPLVHVPVQRERKSKTAKSA